MRTRSCAVQIPIKVKPIQRKVNLHEFQIGDIQRILAVKDILIFP